MRAFSSTGRSLIVAVGTVAAVMVAGPTGPAFATSPSPAPGAPAVESAPSSLTGLSPDAAAERDHRERREEQLEA